MPVISRLNLLSSEGVSVAPQELYREGGLHPKDMSLPRLKSLSHILGTHFQIVGSVHPGSKIERPAPLYIDFVCDDSDGPSILSQSVENFTTSVVHAPPVLIARINEAVIWNGMIFLHVDGEYVPIFENYRYCDRHQVGDDATLPLRGVTGLKEWPDDEPLIYSGMCGSFNYGHWLADDFPGLKGYVDLKKEIPDLRLAYSTWNNALDKCRDTAVNLLCGVYAPPPARFRIDQAVLVKGLHYITPVSQNPYGKNDAALSWARDAGRKIIGGNGPSVRRLFVNRHSSHGRNVKNLGELRDALFSMGFDEVAPEDFSFQEQVKMFSEAESVVGIMGAAMVNTMFCPEKTVCHFLAPDCWAEPYYWDLTGGRPKTYGVQYGRRNTGQAYISDFEVDVELLSRRVRSALPA
jgi:hypothetical protein